MIYSDKPEQAQVLLENITEKVTMEEIAAKETAGKGRKIVLPFRAFEIKTLRIKR